MDRTKLIAGENTDLPAGFAGASNTDSLTLSEADAVYAAQWRAARRFAPLAAGEIAYVEAGEGPAALFLHGFPLNGFQWRHALERLSSVRRCIAPDSLGKGFTKTAKGQSVDPMAQAKMLEALLDYLGVEAVDLVANDSGTAVAQLFAVTNPQRVRTLLLTNGDVEPNSPPPPLQPVLEMAAEGRFADTLLVPWFDDRELVRTAEGLGGLCYSRPGQPTDVALDTYLGPLVATPESKAQVNAYAAALAPNPLAGIEAKLHELQVPTRIVWGMKDVIFDPRMPDYLDDLLPCSQGVRRVPDGKLFWPEEYPEILEEELRRLWGL
jgi:haloalkane dehalogenase